MLRGGDFYMIKSMTGFGRGEASNEDIKITVEMKSVNHRYLDLTVKSPKKLAMFENNMRGIIKEYLERGKVDVYVTYEELGEKTTGLRYNEQLAGQYLAYLRQISEQYKLDFDIRTSTLSRYPDVFDMEEAPLDEDEIYGLLEEALKAACQAMCEARSIEGEKIKNDLVSKLDNMLNYVSYIEERSPEIIKEYKEKLMTKVHELLETGLIDENRIAAEITMYADKICVDEETVRLRSHVSGMRDILINGGSVGRKLDFIAQEMNREANTILSKSTDLSISDTGINLKTDIEKIREQIQNLE